MKNQTHISGLFSALLQLVSGWFLYIFIDPAANLPRAIMNKRKRQVDLLKKIDKFNLVYNYSQLVDIIYKGIIKRYGKTPAQMLSLIYEKAIQKSISSTDDDLLKNLTVEVLPDQEEIKALKTVTDKDGNIFDSKTGKMVIDKNGNIVKQKKILFSDIQGFVDWLVGLFEKLGINSNRSTYSSMTPSYNDWSGQSNNLLSGSLPIIIIAATGLILFSTRDNSSSKDKKSKN